MIEKSKLLLLLSLYYDVSIFLEKLLCETWVIGTGDQNLGLCTARVFARGGSSTQDPESKLLHVRSSL